MRKLFLASCILVISFTLIFTQFACGSGAEVTSGSSKPVELVPEGSNLIATIDIAVILDDTDLTGLYGKMPKAPDDPQTFEDALNRVEEEMGINVKNFEQATMFGQSSSISTDEGEFGLIVTGTFDEQAIISGIEKQSGETLNVSEYKGYKVYTDEAGEVALTFLSESILVFGSAPEVEAVIDVKEGDMPAVSGDILNKYNDLGSALLKLAAVFPEGISTEPTDGQPEMSPFQLDVFGQLRSMTEKVSKSGQTLSSEAQLCFTDPESAEDAKTLFNMILMLPQMVLPGGNTSEMVPNQALEALRGILDHINIETTDSCVDITFEGTISELEQAFSNTTAQ